MLEVILSATLLSYCPLPFISPLYLQFDRVAPVMLKR